MLYYLKKKNTGQLNFAYYGTFNGKSSPHIQTGRMLQWRGGAALLLYRQETTRLKCIFFMTVCQSCYCILTQLCVPFCPKSVCFACTLPIRGGQSCLQAGRCTPTPVFSSLQPPIVAINRFLLAPKPSVTGNKKTPTPFSAHLKLVISTPRAFPSCVDWVSPLAVKAEPSSPAPHASRRVRKETSLCSVCFYAGCAAHSKTDQIRRTPGACLRRELQGKRCRSRGPVAPRYTGAVHLTQLGVT